MCAKIISRDGKSTKDLILDAAFSFYSKPHFDSFSMSELAAKVGVSKPAIYRHFKSRDEVVESMHSHFYDLLAEQIGSFKKTESIEKHEMIRESLAELISFFSENPQYVNFAIYQFSVNQNFEKDMQDNLMSRGLKFQESYRLFGVKDAARNSAEYYTKAIFCGTTILFFIKAREKLLSRFKVESDVKEFAVKLVDFILNGFKGSVSADSILYPQAISEERKKELDKICHLNAADFPEEDKIFKAFAAVIKKHQINGVTVERIADELNMAKSSLYFYFENKNQMIGSLVEKEMQLLRTICTENSAEAKSFSENLYIMMNTEVEFFFMRPSILTICGWLLQNSAEDDFGEGECEPETIWELKINEAVKEINLGFPIVSKIFNFWGGILPVALIVLKERHGFTEKQVKDAVKYLFGFVENGIK